MLLRQTFLYLPAQLLPAAAQLASLLVWAHLVGATALGVVTLFIAVQELLIAAFLLFWNVYTVRYADADGDALRRTTTVVVASSILLQIALGLGFFVVAIDGSASASLLIVLAAAIGSRALNSFQAERARSRADIPLYSALMILGPVAGLLLSVLFLTSGGPHYFYIFLATASAQAIAAIIGLIRDGRWIGRGKPDMPILRHALRYGGPLTIANLSGWVTQNATRLSVAYFIGFAATGVYSLGFGLGFRAAAVAAMSVTAAAFPLAVRLANAGEPAKAMEQLARNGMLVVAIMQASIVGLLLTAEDILRLTVSEDIRSAVFGVMVWTLLGGAFTYIRVHFLNQVFLLKERTSVVAYLAVAEAMLGAMIAVVAVSSWGLLAGAIAFAANALVFLLVMLVGALKLGLPIRWSELARPTVATGTMAVALMLIPASNTVTSLILKILAGVVVFLVAIGALYVTEVRKRLTRAR